MLKRIAPNSPLVIGLGISLAVGLLFFFYSKPSYLALIVGLLGLIISLLVEIIYRLERESTLHSQLDNIPWLHDAVGEIAESLNSIARESRLMPFMEYARRDIKRTAHTTAGMASGQMRARVGDDVLVRQTDLAQKVIRTCSVQAMDVPRWLSDVVGLKIAAKLAAPQRNVRIERVFIYENWTADLKQIVDQQAEAGVHVWVVEAKLADPMLRVDMAVWDDAFTYHFELNSQGNPIENIYSVNEVDIIRRIDQMGLLKSVAQPYDAGKYAKMLTFNPTRTTRKESG